MNHWWMKWINSDKPNERKKWINDEWNKEINDELMNE